MEGFRYYGTGRYFAVTNRFAHKYEPFENDRSGRRYIDRGDIDYYNEPIQERPDGSRQEPTQIDQKNTSDRKPLERRKDPYGEDQDRQYISENAAKDQLPNQKVFENYVKANSTDPKRPKNDPESEWTEGNYGFKDRDTDFVEYRPPNLGYKPNRDEEALGSTKENISKEPDPSSKYKNNGKPQFYPETRANSRNQGPRGQSTFSKIYPDDEKFDSNEDQFPKPYEEPSNDVDETSNYRLPKETAHVDNTVNKYTEPMRNNKYSGDKTHDQPAIKNHDSTYQIDYTDDDFYNSVDGPVLVLDEDQRTPFEHQQFDEQMRRPQDNTEEYKKQSLVYNQSTKYFIQPAEEITNHQSLSPDTEKDKVYDEQSYDDDVQYQVLPQPGQNRAYNSTNEPEVVKAQEKRPVDEEVFCEEIKEVKSEFLSLEELEKYDQESNIESDWPPPPPDEIPQERINGTGVHRDQEIHDGRSELSLYTSFLTIDVNSSRKSDLDTSSLEDSKHRSSLLNLVTGSHEIDHVDDIGNIDKEDMDKIKHDLEMISKYLHNMPLGASFWPQNYDVLRDLVKLYLAAKNTNSAALSYLLDYFLKLDWPEIFLKCAKKIMKSYPQVFVQASDEKIPFEDPTPETLDLSLVSLEYAVAVIFQVILSLAAEFTEVHEPSRKIGHKGFIHFIFQDLLPKLHGIPWGKSTAREEFLHSANDILYNFVQSVTNMACFYECNAVQMLINLRKETDYIGGNRVNIGCLLTLSFLIDDRNNHLILADTATVGLLVHYVEESLSKIDHYYADFSLSELIDGLTRIASHDSNKFVICSQGGISAITKILKKTRDNNERIAVCCLLWSLCFVEKCKQKIIGRSPEIFEIVQDLQDSENCSLRELAEALIWGFEDKYTDQNPPPVPEVKHVFMSYHPEQRATMKKISLRLKDKGYKVWMEKDDNQSYPEHLIEAVENSAVVLIGISRKYKQTPSVFAEADYAFHMCRPMIPIILERNHKPDGWLGMLVGSKVWLDFTEESKFEGHMKLLMRQIGERGKAERTVNILYIPSHQTRGNDNDNGRLIDVSRWGNAEVQEWLQKHNLKNCVADEKLNKLSGSHLLRLHHLRRESPEFYYNLLEPQLGFTDVIDMMEFTQALESLTELV
ncbi:uncharacterized protein LOC135681041 [Rhopilema esculentum]|uniref:uncharacterized protein LOC135681041 n=1 Tax=Rhopilema esculentum TaxID=499914 RepID=UPI0031E3C5A2|eukprot:gene13119-3908_t